MRIHHHEHRDEHRHLVRPRWVWAGTALAVAGVVVGGIGATFPIWWLVGVGVVLLLVGAVLALKAGVLYDVRGSDPGSEVGSVVHGDVHEGVVPGETRSTPAARERAVAVSDRRRALEWRAGHGDGPGTVRPAGAVLLLLCGLLVAAQWSIYPPEHPGQDNALRALGCGILIGFVGLRFCTAQPGSTHRIASALGALGGLLLVANAVLAPHVLWGTSALEVCAGVVALAAAVATVVIEPIRWRRTA